ncbi:hypothetical protein JZ751_025562, partial [Albula glossodonta]
DGNIKLTRTRTPPPVSPYLSLRCETGAVERQMSEQRLQSCIHLSLMHRDGLCRWKATDRKQTFGSRMTSPSASSPLDRTFSSISRSLEDGRALRSAQHVSTGLICKPSWSSKAKPLWQTPARSCSGVSELSCFCNAQLPSFTPSGPRARLFSSICPPPGSTPPHLLGSTVLPPLSRAVPPSPGWYPDCLCPAGPSERGLMGTIRAVPPPPTELWDLNRTEVFHGPPGGLHPSTLLLDEAQDRLTATQVEECLMKGREKSECANYIKVLQRYNRTHLLACGTGAFDPVCAYIGAGRWSEDAVFKMEADHIESGRGRCPFDPHSSCVSSLSRGELFVGLYTDYWENDAALVRLGNHSYTRTERDDRRLLNEPEFVGSAVIPDNGDPDDDKIMTREGRGCW